VDVPVTVRTDCYQIGIPFHCSFENGLGYVSNPYFGLCRESSTAQFGRNLLDQCTSRLLLIFQLRSITLSHLGRRHSVDGLQHM